MDRRYLRAFCAAFVALVLIGGLSGCSGLARGTHASPSSTVVAGIHFSGPWAAQFAALYRDQKSADERAALKDSSISDEEYSYFQNKILSCLSSHGITGKFVAGQVEYDNPQHIKDAVINACMAANGIEILALEDAIKSNPQDLDENTIVTACLVKHKAVPATFTVKDYAKDLQTQEFPVDTTSAVFKQCTNDPLGLQAGK